MAILEIGFDLYTRYFLIAKIVEQVRTKTPMKIIDVGGGGGLLKDFLPDDTIVVMDILPPQDKTSSTYVLGNITQAPFKSRSFDLVVSSDVYEHIPSEKREEFITEMMRLSKGFLILGAPFYSREVCEAEESANNFWLKITGEENRWLREHIANQLPGRYELEEILKQNNYDFQMLGTNNLPTWLMLMRFSYYVECYQVPRDKAGQVFSFYNDNFADLGDFQEPTYRKIYLIGKGGTLPKVDLYQNVKVDRLKQEKLVSLVLDTLHEDSIQEYSKIGILEATLQTKNTQIRQLENQIMDLEIQIEQINSSIVLQLIHRYQRLIEKILGIDTRRRKYYELVLSGIKIILNEGWRSFFRKAKFWLRLKKQIQKRRFQRLPKSNIFITRRNARNLTLPEPSQKPGLSIIIPVYNKWRYTVNCLISLSNNTDGDYEVIVVDDASTDKTVEVLSEVKNLCLIKNEQNVGFVESCNLGAKESKGQYILFLNNDTMVSENWLPPLLEMIEREDVGAVGSKLVYPDGTLQEAGSIVWKDGSALGYGRGDDPDKPEYNYVREVDYCSGSCLLVKRELFEEVAGFDEKFKPGYYEDTDLCFSLRNLGYKIMYQPASVIVHFEGVTGGTDVSSGIKKYELINRPKFIEKWNTILQKYHQYLAPENIVLARNRLPGKNILVLDDRIPIPSHGSGYPRAHSMLKFMGEFGYKVTFFPLDNTTPWQPYTGEFQQSGIEVFYGEDLNFRKFARDRADYYDMILVSRPHNMEKTSDIIERYFPNTYLLYDAEAMFSIREILKAQIKGSERDKKGAELMMNEEINLINKADLIITVSEGEKAIIVGKTGLNNVEVWAHSIEINEPHTPFTERKDILFVGGFLGLDSPNEDAILYFSKEVFPEVEKELSCRLFIVGMNPPKSVRKLSSSSIIVAGYVEDLREYYEKCRIFIVPHRYSAGIPWKLQEAMSYGIPCVISELTASQLNLTDIKEVMVARNTEEFIQKVIRLYQEEELWNQIQVNALNYIREKCNPETLKAKLKEIINRALRG